MNKRATAIGTLLTLASACIVPLTVHAQEAASAEAFQPSRPSVPSTPTVPTTPSQAPGVPYPSSLFSPVSNFEPAGTQASAAYEEVSPALQLRAMSGLERESNVLRTPTDRIADTAFLAGIGLRADRSFGLQRLRADLEANSYRYEKQSALSYNIFNYALAWDWALAPRLHGTVAADRKQYRDVQTDPVTLANTVGRRTERTELVEGVYEAGLALRLSATLTHTRARSSQPGSWDGSPDITSARIGVGYELPSGASLFARYRRGDGQYTDPAPGAPSGRFKEDEADLVLKWPVGGRTSIDARLGRLQRTHEAGPQLDFSGMVGSAAMSWEVTGKTRLLTGVSRELGASGLITGGHVRSDRIFIGPTWNATAALALQLRYDHVSRQWLDIPAGSLDAGRKDSVRVLSASVEWQARRWLAVSGYVRGEQEESSLNTGYRNTTIGAAVKASL